LAVIVKDAETAGGVMVTEAGLKVTNDEGLEHGVIVME
jgi:hypothetical protein